MPRPNGDSLNLYRVGLDGAISAVTQGTGWESGAAVSGSGEMVFTRAEYLPTIWCMPLDANAGAAAPPRKEAAPAGLFGVSRDGSKLVFGRMAGMTKGQLVARDLTACQCRDKTPAILPVLPTRAAVSLGGDAVGTLQ